MCFSSTLPLLYLSSHQSIGGLVQGRKCSERVMFLRLQALKRPFLSLSILPRSRVPATLLTQHVMAASSTWTGEGTQKDFMHKDECIMVNDEDEILGHCSKHACHRFEENQPKGILHRAFRCEFLDQCVVDQCHHAHPTLLTFTDN